MDVMDEAVPVIVDSVARDLVRVRPDIRRQVRVVVIGARVDDGHEDAAAPGGDAPGALGVDIGSGRAARLPGIVKPVLLHVARIIRREADGDEVVRLDVLYVRIAAEALESLLRGDAGAETPVLGTGMEGPHALRRHLGPGAGALRRAGVRPELDEDFPRNVGRVVERLPRRPEGAAG